MTKEIFLALKRAALTDKNKNIHLRKERLIKLLNWINSNESEILNALKKDFNKPHFETYASEISIVKTELKYFIKNIYKWSKPQTVATPLTLIGHKSKIYFEAKGVVLVIAPWNYPFQLAIMPLLAALAAGNTVVIKPSELTTRTAELIKKMMESLFSASEVYVELGAKEKTDELLNFDFDHVFFTGSTRVGQIIAQKCAEKLIPCTLELGGKSPVIIDETADILDAAKKVYWGKFLNRGQTCVAPDYVLIHQSQKENFLKAFFEIEKQTLETPADFITNQHQQRIEKLTHNKIDFKNTKCALIADVSTDDPIMQEEIFGPVAPILTFTSIDDVQTILGKNPHPLALYIFSNNKNNINALIESTQSGGIAINTVIVHLANHNLPFGGIRTSGLGTYHGYAGFLEFTHKRSVIEQQYLYRLIDIIMPPYTDLKNKLIRWL